MEPFSIVLHYAEGDSVPISHVLALFQFAYEFSQQLDDFDAITDFLTTDEERDAIAGIMQKRWLGEGRLVGLKHDVHLLAYVLDPFAQGARTTATQPKCDFLDVEVMNAARTALRHFSKDDSAKRAILLQQFMLWNAAAPALVGQPPVVQASGNNAFSALRLDAMQQVWDKKVTREEKLEAEGAQRDEDSSAFAMREAIANLRLTSSPVEFWLAMMNEVLVERVESKGRRTCSFASRLQISVASSGTLAASSARVRHTNRCSRHCESRWTRRER